MRFSWTRNFAFSVALILLAWAALPAYGDTLSGSVAADNQFNLYLSTSPTVQGTLIDSGTAYFNSFSFSGIVLDPSTTYYLQLEVNNFSGPAGALGSFSLGDSTDIFSNGSQSLNTDTIDWNYSLTGFGSTTGTPSNEGLNDGTAIWPIVSGISSNANWIWDSNSTIDGAPTGQIEYFETQIDPNPVPEPGSLLLLSTGLLVLAGRLKVKSAQNKA